MRKLPFSLCVTGALLLARGASAQSGPPPSETPGSADLPPVSKEAAAPSETKGGTSTPTTSASEGSGSSSPSKSMEPAGAPTVAAEKGARTEVPAKEPPSSPGSDFQFEYHGYFRAPLRVGVGRSPDPADPNVSHRSVHVPRIVDGKYASFAYTPMQEGDWSEIFLSVNNAHVTAAVGLMGAFFSDAASSIVPSSQLGVAQGYVTLNGAPEVMGTPLKVELKVGSYWDRYGYIPKYDTYLVGRTHVVGEHLRVELPLGDFKFRVLHGIGGGRPAPGDAVGFTLLNQVHAGVAYKKAMDVGVYSLESWTNDTSVNGKALDSRLGVLGADAKLSAGPWGNLFVGTSYVQARQADFLAPALEVVHSFGGKGFSENYFGTVSSENGTGSIVALGGVYELSVTDALRSMRRGDEDTAAKDPEAFDVTVSGFGLLTHINSKQTGAGGGENRDGRDQYKWGADVAVRTLPWLGLSMRFDQVVLDAQESSKNFAMLSPRVTVFSHFLSTERVFVQYSRYFYGSQVVIPPSTAGALALRPDEDVMKIQAQVSF